MGSQSAVMSLKEVVVVLIPTGEKLTIATLRVPLASVDAWFIGHYESKAASGGASFFVGIFDQPGN